MTTRVESNAIRRAIAELCESLANERSTHLTLKGSIASVTITGVGSEPSIHNLAFPAVIDPITGLLRVQGDCVRLDGVELRALHQLIQLGFDAEQLSRIRAHVLNSASIDSVLGGARSKSPKILEDLPSAHPSHIDGVRSQPSGVIELFRTLTTRDAFVLADACGNVDGLTGSPIRHLMTGSAPGAFDHHPIPYAFHRGVASLVAVRYHQGLQRQGRFPEVFRTCLSAELGTDDLDAVGLVHPYSLRCWENSSDPIGLDVLGSVDAFVLMSKRSFALAGADLQVKVSFDGRITAHDRNMHPGELHNALANSGVFSALGERRMLPHRTWVFPELASGCSGADRRTSFMVRGGISNALHNDGVGIPEHLTAVSGCTLWSINLVAPNVTLFEALVCSGYDPIELYAAVVRGVVDLYLDFVRCGVVVEAHSQNVLYVFDLQQVQLVGFALRDLADSYMMPDRLAAAGIAYGGISSPDEDEMVVSRLSSDPGARRTLVRQKFDHKIVHLHVEPLARLVHQAYGVAFDQLMMIVRDAIASWVERNDDFELSDAMDVDSFHSINRLTAALNLPGEQYRRNERHLLADLREPVGRGRIRAVGKSAIKGVAS